jgi:type II secretory pathway pseudopilin PulG
MNRCGNLCQRKKQRRSDINRWFFEDDSKKTIILFKSKSGIIKKVQKAKNYNFFEKLAMIRSGRKGFTLIEFLVVIALEVFYRK